jgi:hypothetical protein
MIALLWIVGCEPMNADVSLELIDCVRDEDMLQATTRWLANIAITWY